MLTECSAYCCFAQPDASTSSDTINEKKNICFHLCQVNENVTQRETKAQPSKTPVIPPRTREEVQYAQILPIQNTTHQRTQPPRHV